MDGKRHNACTDSACGWFGGDYGWPVNFSGRNLKYRFFPGSVEILLYEHANMAKNRRFPKRQRCFSTDPGKNRYTLDNTVLMNNAVCRGVAVTNGIIQKNTCTPHCGVVIYVCGVGETGRGGREVLDAPHDASRDTCLR
jgi:hypothetical protein